MKITGERFVPGYMQKHSEVEHMHRYSMLENTVKKKIVLDAACGSGYGTNLIAQSAKEVYGLDISKEALDYANENYKKDNLHYLHGSIESLPFEDNFFDVVISFETIEHVDEKIQMAFLKEIVRVLKNDGILIMSTPNKKVYTDDAHQEATEWHVKEFYEDEFHDFIESRFQYVTYYEQFIAKASHLVNDEKRSFSAYNYENRNKGKFIIAMASNQKIEKSNNLNSLYYYPDEYARINDTIQVYYGEKQNELNERDCINIEYCNGDSKIVKRVTLDGIAVRCIRIDPSENSCCLKIGKIAFRKPGEDWQEVLFDTNADAMEDDVYCFYHRDPQIIIQLAELTTVQELLMEFEIFNINQDIYTQWKKEINERKKLEQELAVVSGKKEFIQLYYGDSLDEINEQNRIDIEYDATAGKIDRKVDLAGIRAAIIRLDPLEHRCILKNISLRIKAMGKKEQECEYYTNADKMDGEYYSFYSDDPQIIIKLPANDILDYVSFKFEIVDYNMDIYRIYQEEKDENEEYKRKIKEIESKLSQACNEETYLQVYYADGRELISEEQSMIEVYDRGSKRIKKRIAMNGIFTKCIRIDPVNENCRIKINYVRVKIADAEEQTMPFVTNADQKIDEILVFWHKDPQIIMELQKASIVEYIDIDFEIESIGEDLYPVISMLNSEQKLF
ncbi:MAG: class I SAM-dependent methyltransferase [Eubacteriales bacterium]|nr:class I SAM-dependent methyltransferase [Eubacteriales bacterium]